MGYLRHECMVVSGWSAERVMKAHDAATTIFNSHRIGSLVSGITGHIVNGGCAFMIAPDGSKEGWEDSNIAEIARGEFIDFLRSKEAHELYLEWALILLGGDDGEYRVLKSPEIANA